MPRAPLRTSLELISGMLCGTLCMLLLLALPVIITGCGSASPPADRAPDPVPAEAEAARLRAVEPPAAAEVRDLRAQELAAGIAAAHAIAAHNDAEADHQRALAAELAKLRTTAETREQAQRAQIAALAADADRRAAAERDELAKRDAQNKRDAQDLADRQRTADDQHRAHLLAAWGSGALIVAALVVFLITKNTAIAAAIPTIGIAGLLTVDGFLAAGWLMQTCEITIVLAGLAWLGWHLYAHTDRQRAIATTAASNVSNALAATALYADTLESRVVDAARVTSDSALAAIANATASAKAEAASIQEELGVRSLIATARGKNVPAPDTAPATAA